MEEASDVLVTGSLAEALRVAAEKSEKEWKEGFPAKTHVKAGPEIIIDPPPTGGLW